jgi:NADH-quinone oxidoreductase subunit G
MNKPTVKIDGKPIPIDGESNLLEILRKANINLPTFCYHSEISVYGACRMCMVEIEGRGLLTACTTAPADGMVVTTSSKQIRDIRKMIVELMLAAHDNSCTTCPKSGDCKLQRVAKQMGVQDIRFKKATEFGERDESSVAIARDPSKCILCGDCVRVCAEVQCVGVLDFSGRGADSKVVAGFNKPIGETECVNCGQCVKVCPVGALYPKSQIDAVWAAIQDPSKTVVVHFAPAVRVALGEYFGFDPGTTTTGQLVTALRMMGFDKVFDTSFAADLTVVEEGKEFLARFEKDENLPQFTSCCPAWVKFAEQYCPEMLPNLSTCKSPMGMFGALAKDMLPGEYGIDRKDLVVVAIMPCTAKKYEAERPEFGADGIQDTDYVLTVKELCTMIDGSGVQYNKLEPGSVDQPLGFFTGAGVIFGTSGGVSEAVLRFVASKFAGGKWPEMEIIRSNAGLKTAEVEIAGKTLRLAIVSGLNNAKNLVDNIRAGKAKYDLIEVMACCGGCVNGGGQPDHKDNAALGERTKKLYKNDRLLQYHSSDENPNIQKIYDELLDEHKAHELFHTTYTNRG